MKHLTDEEVAAYLDRALPPEGRVAADEHLAACKPCRDELHALSALVSSAPSPKQSLSSGRRILAWWTGGLLAAAGVAGMLVLGRPAEHTPTSSIRGSVPAQQAEEALRLPAVAPPVHPAVSGQELTFRWGSAGQDVLYHLVVLDEAGGLLWSGSVEGLTFQLPHEIHLAAGNTYYWRVDALLPDGRTATTGIRRFALR